MASYYKYFCTLCQEDDVFTPAVSWCLECEQWLCTDCEKHHGRSKTSKQHKTIKVNVYAKLPEFVLNFSKRCIEHDYGFEHYCSFHGVPCCVHCVSKAHKECELRPLNEVLQNVRESSAVSHLEKDLIKIQENLDVIEKHLQVIIKQKEDEKKVCLNEIKRVRTSVNAHLDKIERDVVSELSNKEKTIKEAMEGIASQIKIKKRSVENLQDSFSKTKQYATDFQLFLTIKEMEKQTSKDMEYLADFENEGMVADKCLKLVVSPALQSFQKDVVEFGRISVHSVPSTLKLKESGNQQVPVYLPIMSTLDSVNLVKTITINLSNRGKPNLQITSCSLLQAEQCVFVDYNNDSLMLYNNNGTNVRNLPGTVGYPYDMCYIKEIIIGITYSDKQKVHLIDVSKSKTVKVIDMESSCYGIDCDDGKLFIRLPDVGKVVVMDPDGKIEQHLSIAGKDILRIACFKNNIYCTDWQTSEVFCYNIHGMILWKHKYEALIKPRSITINKRSGIIFIAGLESTGLHAISLDGHHSRVVLSNEYAFSCVISKDNKLLVCNDSKNLAIVYKL